MLSSRKPDSALWNHCSQRQNRCRFQALSREPSSKKKSRSEAGVVSRLTTNGARGVPSEELGSAGATRRAARVERSDAIMAILQPGSSFPAFALPNQDGKTVRLGDFAGRWLVVYVYPKDDTPGCTIQ